MSHIIPICLVLLPKHSSVPPSTLYWHHLCASGQVVQKSVQHCHQPSAAWGTVPLKSGKAAMPPIPPAMTVSSKISKPKPLWSEEQNIDAGKVNISHSTVHATIFCLNSILFYEGRGEGYNIIFVETLWSCCGLFHQFNAVICQTISTAN